MRAYNRPLSVDFKLLGEAQCFYEEQGFHDVAVPWVVKAEAYEETKPSDVASYETLGGFLVASAEQSFLQLLLDGTELGMSQATTPCFRDEEHDATHWPYFMKNELYSPVATVEEAERVMFVAKSFLDEFLPTKIISLADGSFDLVCSSSGLELGSYGVRAHGVHSWVYGTGPCFAEAFERSCSTSIVSFHSTCYNVSMSIYSNFLIRRKLRSVKSAVSVSQAAYLDHMIEKRRNPWYGEGVFVNHLNVDLLSSLSLCGRNSKRNSTLPASGKATCRDCSKRWLEALERNNAWDAYVDRSHRISVKISE